MRLRQNAKEELMFVCTCCGNWKITPHPNGLRIKHCGYFIKDVKSIEEVAKVLEPYGVRLTDLEER